MNLPTEVWINILKDVVCVPGYNALHTKLPYQPSSFFEDPKDDSLHELIIASIDAKVSLSFVCIQWAGILRESLFEIIAIRKPKQLRLLADTLAHRPLYGTYVRRIDMCLRQRGVTDVSGETMEAVMKACVNLEIFIDRNYSYRPAPYEAMDLLARYAPKLRHFDFPEHGQTRQNIRSLVKYAPHLTRLELLFLPQFESLGEWPLSPLSFPCLHSLTIDLAPKWDDFVPNIATWDLPALTNVRIVATGGHPVDPTPFFQSHGHKIKILICSSLPPSHRLEDILAACSLNLEALFHPVDITNLFNPALKHMPRLSLIGLLPHMSWGYSLVDRFEELFDMYFDSKRMRFPELKELSFAYCEPYFQTEMWSKKRIRAWKKQQARWHLNGVNFVMPGGRLFPNSER